MEVKWIFNALILRWDVMCSNVWVAIEISLLSSFHDVHSTRIPEDILIFISGWLYTRSTRIEVIRIHSYKVATLRTEEGVPASCFPEIFIDFTCISLN